MFKDFFERDDFFNKYLDLFINRYTITNLTLEDAKTEASSPKRALEMYNNKLALTTLLFESPTKITPYDLINIANIINNGVYSKGFRKTFVEVKKAKNFIPIDAKDIPNAIYSLFDAYHNIWSELNPYEKEARLHIELVRIQPFEDGNKRTARTITNYNLLKLNKAPIIIGNDENNKYFDLIDNYDIKGLTEMFMQKSKEELTVMRELYNNIRNHNELNFENECKIYTFVRDRK